jgi:hypothetical protein
VQTGAARGPEDDHRPIGLTGRAGLCESGGKAPFAWQDGRQLWILDAHDSEWILAELRFEPEFCRYLEVRRATYCWPREAAGALLSRAFAGGQARAEEAARRLNDWLSRTSRTS